MENETQFVFRISFSWKNWKTNYLNRSRLTLWLFSNAWSARYSKVSSCQVPWDFPLYSGHADTKNLLFRKHINIYITGCYFRISFILIVNCDLKHISKILLNSLQKSFINLKKVDLKFKRTSWKINVKDFILCSVPRTVSIIWNTFSCSKKLLPFRRTHPH